MIGTIPTPTPTGHRIALTGGPGGGKSTAADLFRRELGDEVVLVPEAATILFSGGFPRHRPPTALAAAQRAIFHVQRNLEDIHTSLNPGKVLLCDRGTVDGAAYWPGDPDSFFAEFGSALDAELARYDAVIFFESAAVGGFAVDSGNPVRTESLAEAAELDHRLRALWSHHPQFVIVPHNVSFFRKITHGLATLESMVSAVRNTSVRTIGHGETGPTTSARFGN